MMFFCFSEGDIGDEAKITAYYDADVSQVIADKYEDSAPHDFSKFWDEKRKRSFTIIYIFSGSVTVYCGSREYVFSAGDCYFIPSGIRFRSHWTPAKYYCFHIYHAANHFENVYLNPFAIQKVPQMSVPETGERFQKIWEEFQSQSTADRARAFGELYLLWAEILSLLKTSDTPNAPSSELAAALLWMEEHQGENFRVADVARAVHMSESAFYHMFSRELDETPREYIERLRVRTSVALLREGNMSLSQIASDCGFPTLSSFRTAFRRFYGISPADFRKER